MHAFLLPCLPFLHACAFGHMPNLLQHFCGSKKKNQKEKPEPSHRSLLQKPSLPSSKKPSPPFPTYSPFFSFMLLPAYHFWRNTWEGYHTPALPFQGEAERQEDWALPAGG